MANTTARGRKTRSLRRDHQPTFGTRRRRWVASIMGGIVVVGGFTFFFSNRLGGREGFGIGSCDVAPLIVPFCRRKEP